jgi:hypothetical protein
MFTRTPFPRQDLRRLEAVLGHRQLHHDVLVDLREVLALYNHLVRLETHGLGADGTVHDRTDLADRLSEVPSLLGDERRVRRDGVHDLKLAASLISFTFAISIKNFIR